MVTTVRLGGVEAAASEACAIGTGWVKWVMGIGDLISGDRGSGWCDGDGCSAQADADVIGRLTFRPSSDEHVMTHVMGEKEVGR